MVMSVKDKKVPVAGISFRFMLCEIMGDDMLFSPTQPSKAPDFKFGKFCGRNHLGTETPA